MLAILGWIIFGIVIGFIARALYPGPQPMGFLGTMLLGIVGSLLGGGITWLVTGDEYSAAGWIMSIVGAMILIFFGVAGMRRRRTM